MGVFSRSWQITKLSFSVIKEDKELLLFPIISGFFSMIFVIAMLFPTVITTLINGNAFESNALFYVILFLIYFGLAFIATFFNVCVVYTTKIRFEGGNATFMESLKFSFSKLHLIAMWSLLSASVGLLLRMLDNLAKNMGKGGQILMSILTSLLGMAWSILTIFVVPGLVYYDLTPFTAIKKSTQTLKTTWGESLIRNFGLGIMQVMFFILGIIVFVGLFALVSSLGGYAILAIFILALIYFVMLFLIFGVANSVYNTALFVYADKGIIPNGFTDDVMQNAFSRKN